MIIQSKESMAEALGERVNAFIDFVSDLDPSNFEATPEQKWSAGQNLEHLVRATRPVVIAMDLPKFLLRLLFGTANRPSRTFEGLVEKYKTKLAAGGRASRPFIPPVITYDKREKLIRRFRRLKDKLIRKMDGYREEDLDHYILPHPLLGKITLREMIFFTIHHTGHHLDILKKRNR